MLCALPCMGVTSDRGHTACRQGMHSDVHNLRRCSRCMRSGGNFQNALVDM